MTATSTVLPPGVEAPGKSREASPVPLPKPEWSIPKVIFTVEDLNHSGAGRVFQGLGDPVPFLRSSIIAIYELLFSRKTVPTKYV